MSASTLPEPQVLAHTKQHLFQNKPDTYAVVDTQFAKATWLSDQPIDAAIRERLAPFNHVEIGGGYPDLVGVTQLPREYLAVDRLGDEPPLIAIEAKGFTDHQTVDTERGITQAYDRLHEANVAYLAAPTSAISQTDRTLARECNVGILGVDTSGAVEPIERPRVVGNRTTDEATAIRFQASAQGVADKSFGLNHPKNYVAYPIALHAAGETAPLVDEHVVGAVDSARQGAAFLGLVDEQPNGLRLTPLGREVVRFAIARHGSAESALEEFEQYQRSRKCFYDVAPQWGDITRRVVYEYPATQLLVEELQTMHDDGITEPTLVDLVTWLHEHHQTFTIELFVKGEEDVRSRVLDDDGNLQHHTLDDGEIYHSPTVFQLKAMLYHAGIVTDTGAEPHRLEPSEDIWPLREPV